MPSSKKVILTRAAVGQRELVVEVVVAGSASRRPPHFRLAPDSLEKFANDGSGRSLLDQVTPPTTGVAVAGLHRFSR